VNPGDTLQWHPHLHILVTDGAFSENDTFLPAIEWNSVALMKLFRERLLACLVERHAISEELAQKLPQWRHPGFSAHVGEPMPPDDPKAIEDMAGHVTRNPLSLKRLVYIDGQQAVIYKALKPNPSLGQNFEAMDPLEWLARMTEHIPDPGKHRTLFYAYYVNRLRGERAAEEPGADPAEAGPPKKRRCSPSWARVARLHRMAREPPFDPTG
jgi:Putative transposase